MGDANPVEMSAGVEARAPGAVEIATEPGAGWLDIGVTALVIAVAVYYLYRKLWRNQGRCSDCGSKGQGACPTGIARDACETRVEVRLDPAGGKKT